jgi:hypothetical protein
MCQWGTLGCNGAFTRAHDARGQRAHRSSSIQQALRSRAGAALIRPCSRPESRALRAGLTGGPGPGPDYPPAPPPSPSEPPAPSHADSGPRPAARRMAGSPPAVLGPSARPIPPRGSDSDPGPARRVVARAHAGRAEVRGGAARTPVRAAGPQRAACAACLPIFPSPRGRPPSHSCRASRSMGKRCANGRRRRRLRGGLEAAAWRRRRRTASLRHAARAHARLGEEPGGPGQCSGRPRGPDRVARRMAPHRRLRVTGPGPHGARVRRDRAGPPGPRGPTGPTGRPAGPRRRRAPGMRCVRRSPDAVRERAEGAARRCGGGRGPRLHPSHAYRCAVFAR